MKLINGRGQLGEALSQYEGYPDIEVYHTWNFLDKSATTQSGEVEKLREYLKNNYKKIIFISTTTKQDSSYLRCKREAEELVLAHSNNNLVIRFSSIIGRGVFSGLRDKKLQPFGIINYISLKEAREYVLNSAERTGIIECPSWQISAETLVELMEFSKL